MPLIIISTCLMMLQSAGKECLKWINLVDPLAPDCSFGWLSQFDIYGALASGLD